MHIQSSQLEINATEVQEDLATNRARVVKLRDLIAGDRVDGFFEAHRGDFETIAVALLRVASKRIAAEITAAVGGAPCDERISRPDDRPAGDSR
jgi:hypothetical protein